MFKLAKEFFEKNNNPHHIIISNKYNSNKLNILYVCYKLLFKYRKDKIYMLNISNHRLTSKAILITLISKLYKNPLVIRIFGGKLIDGQNQNTKLFKFIFRNSLTLLETKLLLSEHKNDIPHLSFYPNIRTRKSKNNTAKNYNKKFLFLSQVKEEKGLDLILSAIEKLDNSYTIDIYGPILDSKYKFLSKKSFYKGTVSFDQTFDVIQSYDVILLPTHWPTEGYPGTIIEGYSQGKPAIVTNWRALPEIVDHKSSGYVMRDHSVESLIEGIKYFNEENYVVHSDYAFNKFEMFDSDKVQKGIYHEMLNFYHSQKDQIKS